MRKYTILSLLIIAVLLIYGCGKTIDTTEIVPLEELTLSRATVNKPSALYETQLLDEEEQFYFLDAGDEVELVKVLYAGGPAYVRTDDGEEGWCGDIEMTLELTVGSLYEQVLSTRYPGGVLTESEPGIILWSDDGKDYALTGVASADFTGNGTPSISITEFISSSNGTDAQVSIIEPESYKNICATEPYAVPKSGIDVRYHTLSDAGLAGFSVVYGTSESLDAPLREKRQIINDTYLYNDDLTMVLSIVVGEDIISVGAANPPNIVRGDSNARFFLRRNVSLDFVPGESDIYDIIAKESSIVYCYDGQEFGYVTPKNIVYQYGTDKLTNKYSATSGKFFSLETEGSGRIVEPAKIRRQPYETGDPIRIIEAEEKVRLILTYPDIDDPDMKWHYIDYTTKESEKKYAGWVKSAFID